MQSYAIRLDGDDGILANRIRHDLDALSVEEFERDYDIANEDVYSREATNPARGFWAEARDRPVKAAVATALALVCAVALIAGGVLIMSGLRV
jgi:hypothetical protein